MSWCERLRAVAGMRGKESLDASAGICLSGCG